MHHLHLHSESTPVTLSGWFWAKVDVWHMIRGRCWGLSWWSCQRLNIHTFSTLSRRTWRRKLRLQMGQTPDLTLLRRWAERSPDPPWFLPSRPLKPLTCQLQLMNTAWWCQEKRRQLLMERSRVLCWPGSEVKTVRLNRAPTAAHLHRSDPDRLPEFAWRKGLTPCLRTLQDSKIFSLHFLASRLH